ncbi:MAG: flippase-like domain-containing protein [Candidatus Nomurabacteria bacterium]|jgi:uncharacterized protein (TIRG00374 family)|nr:flippase-like domain-containing protein [Candidatus Nomurabacteria bacterium]
MFKKILSIATVVLVGVVVWMARDEIGEALHHLARMNIWIFLLIIPAQLVMYFAAGQVYFSYIRSTKKMKKVSTWKLMRISFELNFVNHIVPSGGVSGLAYLAWRLKSVGIKAGQAAMMQVVRYGLVAIATALVMSVSAVILALTGVKLSVAIFSLLVAVGLLAAVAFVVWLIQKRKRIDFFGTLFSRAINKIVRFLSFGKVKHVLAAAKVEKFLGELHTDYGYMMGNKKALKRPFLWSVFYSLMDSGTFYITFLALGADVGFAPVIIAQGLASIVGTVVVTPGGAGFFEVVMAGYFVATGIDPAVAVAATVVTRVVVLLGTIGSGWGFYQHALLSESGKKGRKHGAGTQRK